MEIRVLGPGCMKCNKLYVEAEKAIAQSGREVSLIKVDKLDEIMAFGVLMTPALVVDQQVKCSGRVPPATEILAWINAASAEG